MSDKTFDNIAFGDRDDSYCVGDPVLTDENINAVIRLKERFDEIEAIPDPNTRLAAAREMMTVLGDVSL